MRASGAAARFASCVRRGPFAKPSTFVLLVLGSLAASACHRNSGLPAAAANADPAPEETITLAPEKMPRLAVVDARYQSYNIEMVEVTGGRFWRPYGPEVDDALQLSPPVATAGKGASFGNEQPARSGEGATPVGMNPALYEHRPPINLTNARLRRLAAALGPAYVRVSGTWANTTYFADSSHAPAEPPKGFSAVLTREQWRGVIEFATAADAQIVTSFATSAGTRDAKGEWTPRTAEHLIAYTRSHGGRIAAAEFMNEPNLAAMGGAPGGYDAAAFGRDFKVFRAFADKAAPDMRILGPGSVGESGGASGLSYGGAPVLATRELLAASDDRSDTGLDAFSYHHYGAASRRCAAMDSQTTADEALSEQWLSRTDETLAFYRKLRDEFAPGKPLWLTETADAACGGNPWASTFLDSFRYLDQLGRLAKQSVQVVAHNTLAASDYGLLDESTFEPRPNYWAAWLWRQFMGEIVLDSGIPVEPGLHVYAHCLRDSPGGVAVLAINTDRAAARTMSVPEGVRYTLASPAGLQRRSVELNDEELKLGQGDALPSLKALGISVTGDVELAPATITFLTFPAANNESCRQSA